MVESTKTRDSAEEAGKAKFTVGLSYSRKIMACTQCSQRAHCTEPVPGTGPFNAKMMLVGDYPYDESLASFDRPAWMLLLTVLEEIGAISWQNAEKLQFVNNGVFITTAVKCGDKTGHKPRAKEMAKCRPWLGAQIGVLGPGTVIVGLGNLAIASITGKPLSKCKVSFTHGTVEAIKERFVVHALHPGYVVKRGHDTGGRARDQLKTDLEAAWRIANRELVQSQES